MALIEVNSLSHSYGTRVVLNNIDMRLDARERIAILGANGSGKTTLARYLAGWLPEKSDGERDAVLYKARPWLRWPLLERVRSVQLVGQFPAQHLSGRAFSVFEEVAFGLENLGVDTDEIVRRVKHSLELCMLHHLAERNPFTLSGGEQQRLLIASALALKPAVLILDEPFTNLDPESRDHLVSLLNALPPENLVVLFDTIPDNALGLCDRFLLLEQGEIFEKGNARDVLVSPSTVVAPELPAIDTETTERLPVRVIRDRNTPSGSGQSERTHSDLITVEDISFRYEGGQLLFSHLNFHVAAGQCLAIVGRNGVGKSTLFRLLNGLLRPLSGSIEVDGKNTSELKVNEIAAHVGTLFQTPEQQLFAGSVRDEVSFGPRQFRLTSEQLEQRVADALERCEINHLAEFHPLDLDYATRRFVALASVLALEPRIILLDEPQRGLDRMWSGSLERIINEERARGHAVIMISHDLRFVARNADVVLALDVAQPLAQPTVKFFDVSESVPDALALVRTNRPVEISKRDVGDAW